MSRIPVFPLNSVLLPGGLLPLRIFESRYLDMVTRSLREDSPFAISLLTSGAEVGEAAGCESIGVSVKVYDWEGLPGDLLGVTVLAQNKVRLSGLSAERDNLLKAEAEVLPPEPDLRVRDIDSRLVDLLRRILKELPLPYSSHLSHFDDLSWVANRLVEVLPFPLELKQRFLEESSPVRRMDLVHEALKRLELNPNG